MAVVRRGLAFLILLLTAGPLVGAEVPGEAGAFNSAINQLHDSWSQQAEAGFADFTRRFTNSARLPEAYLYQAVARYQMSNYTGAIELLLARQSQAGKSGDQYLLWLGQANLKKGDYAAAAGAFSNLVSQFRDSPSRTEGAVGEATAWAKREDWARVIALLEKRDGVFQNAARTNAATEAIQSGYLLLAEGLTARQDYAGAEATLQPMAKESIKPAMAWERQRLLCQIRVAQGRLPEALQNTTNLLLAAAGTADHGLLAESVAFQAGLLEQLGRAQEALVVFTNNLAAGVPVERQREALRKITAGLLSRDRPGEAAQMLEEFAARNTNAPPADLALLMLGELRLAQHVAAGTNRPPVTATNAAAATAELLRAIKALTDLSSRFPQSPYLGRGELDLGWCLWEKQDWAGCQAACQAAVERLHPSPDQATARFKLADAQFEQTNFMAALSNYMAVAKRYADLPEVKTNLAERALYQAVRAGLDGGSVAAANDAMSLLLASYPTGCHTERATLLAGQALSHHGNPAAARELFLRFARIAPNAPLLPQIGLAVARTFEQEGKLPEAVREYDHLLERYTNCPARAEAEYCRALDCSLAGDQDKAFVLFTNFVARFPTNELAPLALFSIGSYHFNNRTNGPEAEKMFKLIFDTNSPPSGLSHQAQMMAGRTAFLLGDWKDATRYFTGLVNDPGCPAELQFQALFAYGDTLMSQQSTNQAADYQEAIRVFGRICRDYSTNRQVFLAFGQEALCHLQWAMLTHQYDDLTNALLACQQVTDATNAHANARSMALISQAIVLCRQADLKTGPEKKALLEAAIGKYLAVFYGTNLNPGEPAESFWVEKAGRELAQLLTDYPEVQNYKQARSVYERLKKLLPMLAPSIDDKIARLIKTP